MGKSGGWKPQNLLNPANPKQFTDALANTISFGQFSVFDTKKKKKPLTEAQIAFNKLQYKKAPEETGLPATQSSIPSLMPKEAKIKQSRTNSLNAMRAGSFGLMK